MPPLICRCGKPAHPCFGGRCEDHWAEDNSHTVTDIYKEDIENLNPGRMSRYEKLELPISFLKLSDRVTNRLCDLGIRYVEDLVESSEEKLLRVGGLGEVAIKDIKNALSALELKLSRDPLSQQ